MKIKIFLLMIFIIIYCNFVYAIDNIGSNQNELTINFQDEKMYQAVSQQINGLINSKDDSKYSINISNDNLSKVTILTLNNSNITDITGVENFINLEELNLSNNKIIDITKLSNLTKLKTLKIYGNAISDISSLGNLTGLEYLDISKNKLFESKSVTEETSILSKIKTLMNLKYLDVSHNLIINIGSLSNLTELTYLDLYDNNISDLKALENLTKLEILKLGENNEKKNSTFSNLEVLNNLKNLTYLDFSENYESTIINNINQLTQLKYLQLESNSLTDLSGIESLVNLRTLNLNSNSLEEVSGLSKLSNLEILRIGNNKIKNISNFYNGSSLVWNNLKILDISENSINNNTDVINYLNKQSKDKNIELNYEYITDTSNLPHYDNNGTKYITYEEFGARCDGTYDDFIAIRNAHLFANKYGYEVRGTEGKTYHIYNYYGSSITITTNIDWQNANFIIHDEDIEEISGRYEELFKITSNEAKDIVNIRNPDWTINTNTKKIEGLQATLQQLNSKGYTQFWCKVENANKKQYIRFGNNANTGINQQDYFLIDSEGNILNDIQWDFEQITAISIMPISNNLRYMKNGKFITNSLKSESETPYRRLDSGKRIYYGRHISIYHTSNINIDNVKHTLSEDKLSGSYIGFLVLSYNANVNILNSELFTRQYNLSGRSTYDLSIDGCVNVTCSNIISNEIYDDNRWGIVETDFCKDIIFKNSTLNRIDAHQGIYNLTIENCNIGCKGLTMTGQGILNIINSTITSETFIQLRNDYGSTWDGNVNIINCNYVYHGTTQPKLFSFKFSYDDNENKILHDFGYKLKFPNVYVNNLKIDAKPKSTLYIMTNFGDLIGKPYNGNPNYWPNSIYINGYQFKNDSSNSCIKLSLHKIDKNENEEYNYIITDLNLYLQSKDGQNITKRCNTENSTSTKENVYLELKENNSNKNKISIYKNNELIVENVEIENIYSYNFEDEGIYRVQVNSVDNYLDGYYTGSKEYEFEIDKTVPELSTLYSSTQTTNQDVVATITSNEEILGVEGWTLSEDKKRLTKIYTKNCDETVKICDLAGNSTNVEIVINNIDKSIIKENEANISNNAKRDTTIAKEILPNAGTKSIILFITILIIISLIVYIKLKKYKDIK